MKNLGKIVGMIIMTTVCLSGLTTQASTGDTTGTGGVDTGTVDTGNTILYTGSLLTYLNTQESSVGTLLTSAYGQLYTTFIKTGLNILKSIDYQSLVCLGAIKDVSLLSQLQKDKTRMTIAFKQDFIDLENQVLALEEKQALQESDNVNVFDVGTTYESERAKLKELIDAKVKLHKGFISNFATSYATKNTEFLTTYLQYSAANKDLVKGIQDKMTRIKGILAMFADVESTIQKINAKITGLDDIIKKMEEAKNKGLKNLDTTLQPLIDTNIKKYKSLQNFIDELTKQKAYLVGQYQMDFDEYLSNSFQNRYNRTQYLALKDQVNSFRSKFYTSNNQLNCSNMLSSSDEGTILLGKINTMKIAVNSGLAKIETEGISDAFKNQLYSGFQSLYIQKFKQRYTEYTKYIKEAINTALKTTVDSLIPTITPPTPVITTSYVFTKPFKSGEYNEGIKALQNLLTTLKLYSGAIDGIYNKATKNAVYQFQLSKGLLKGYENKPDTWGWMGPATRNALNQLMK